MTWQRILYMYAKILGANNGAIPYIMVGRHTPLHSDSTRRVEFLEKDMQATTVYNLIYRLKAEGVD